MTEREIAAFEDMFSMIFSAVTEKKVDADSPKDKNIDVGIGRGGAYGDLFGKLRRHSKKMKWTTESDELLDQQKEAMDLCDTDQQLLEWAMREVFGESERYEKESRQVMDESSKSGNAKSLPMLQPPTYPHLIAHLMRTFRDKYSDPHLAMAMFDHARHLSIPSYVFGCSTMAYNELIETRWRCFRDLKGVYDALLEMSVNGVDLDSRTRKLVETLRREVGERNLWMEEDVLGSGEVWAMLSKIEELTAQKKRARQRPDPSIPIKWDDWKVSPMEDQADDGWGFDQWDKPTYTRPY
jgi:hypothetical protein